MTFQPRQSVGATKPEIYAQLRQDLTSLLAGERDFIANAANMSALVYQALPQINWAGFYVLRGEELVLGPFQGQPACVRIALGKGVCGTAAIQKQTVIVPDVHQFPGHIACDSASNAEIVVPVLENGRLIGVFDVDSPEFDRFDEKDARGLNDLVEIFMKATDVNL